jgi:hypothetical protein
MRPPSSETRQGPWKRSPVSALGGLEGRKRREAHHLKPDGKEQNCDLKPFDGLACFSRLIRVQPTP